MRASSPRLSKNLDGKAAIERPAIVAQEAFKLSGLLPMLLQADDRVESLAAIRAFLNMFEELSLNVSMMHFFLALLNLSHFTKIAIRLHSRQMSQKSLTK